MDYSEARAAFFAPRPHAGPATAWQSPARRLRDALEPLATVSFWAEPAYDAYAALGLDFLTGYVWSRSSVLGLAEPTVVAATFGVFEPAAVAGLLTAARGCCSLEQIRAARERGAVNALREVLPDGGGLTATTDVLRGARNGARQSSTVAGSPQTRTSARPAEGRATAHDGVAGGVAGPLPSYSSDQLLSVRIGAAWSGP